MQDQSPWPAFWNRLKWVLLFLLNLAVLVAIPPLFLYTISQPPTAENLAAMPYFAGSTVLDVAGYGGSEAPLDFSDSKVNWVLYETGAGETRLVRLAWDRFFPRYRIQAGQDMALPTQEDPCTLTVQVGLRQEKITVTDQSRITHFYTGTASTFRELYKTLYLAGAALLLLPEALLGMALQKRKEIEHW